MFDILGEMLLEVTAAATPVKVALGILAAALVVLVVALLVIAI